MVVGLSARIKQADLPALLLLKRLDRSPASIAILPSRRIVSTEARMPGCLPHGYRIGENGRPARWMFETVETISALLQPGRFLMRCHPSLLPKVDQACPRASMSG